jgi:UDP-N-acetylmuramate dehydrogenase
MRIMPMVSATEVTSIHCGGTIKCVYEPENTDQLVKLLQSLDSFVILGGGTNTIFVDSLVIRPVIRLGREFAGIKPCADGIRAGAAVPMKRLFSHCARNGLSGIEFMAGIPGWLGGAVYMNAGTPDRGFLDAVEEIEVADRNGVRTIPRKGLACGYRTGGISPDTVVVSATLRLERSSKEAVRKAALPYLEKKKLQPKGYNSGSIFRNPEGTAAGLLIDRAGLKGMRVGGAKVSEVHANFIINEGNASTSDITGLISMIKQRVHDEFGIELKEEVRIVGQ